MSSAVRVRGARVEARLGAEREQPGGLERWWPRGCAPRRRRRVRGPRGTGLRDARPARRWSVARDRRRPSAHSARPPSPVVSGRAGVRRMRYSFQSGVADAGHLAERGDEARPIRALAGQHLRAGVGDPVVAPSPLARLLDPPPADPAPRFHSVERGVERGQRELSVPPERSSICRAISYREGRRPRPGPGSGARRCPAWLRRRPAVRHGMQYITT